LMAQIGSVIPASYCKLGIVKSLGVVYISKVDIGAGQSTFTRNMNCLGEVLDFADPDSLVLLDDATEGTDEDNANDYMDFILETFAKKKVTSYISTQQQRLEIADIARDAIKYTTVPGTYKIMPISKEHPLEFVPWRKTAEGSTLGDLL
jgi:DNA mismatch repair ATPase MutS